MEDAEALIEAATQVMVEAGYYFIPDLTLKVDVSSSILLPGRAFEPLAGADTLVSYQGHLERVRNRHSERLAA